MIGVVGLIGLDWIGYWLLMDFGLVVTCAYHYFMHDHVCKENWVFVYCIHVHVFMKTGFSCENGIWVRVYHDPKPRWGIISVELLWLLGSGIY